MKSKILRGLTFAMAGLMLPASLWAAAATVAEPVETWHARNLGEALLYTAIFSIFGLVLAVVGYKLFDKFTPGDLHREIIENKNQAAAIIGAAVILGVCIIIAAAILG
jgi:uncharacterized membrane protein YjfL (UPF0719 family)